MSEDDNIEVFRDVIPLLRSRLSTVSSEDISVAADFLKVQPQFISEVLNRLAIQDNLNFSGNEEEKERALLIKDVIQFLSNQPSHPLYDIVVAFCIFKTFNSNSECHIADLFNSDNCNITYTRINNILYIHLPNIYSEVQIVVVAKSLFSLYNSIEQKCDWVVDCTLINSMSDLLIDWFISINRRLKVRGYLLYLCWLKSDALTLDESDMLRASFDLVEKSGYWFSCCKDR